MAYRAHNLLANGMGGLDWAGLPVVAEYLGVDDLADLIARMEVIKLHRPEVPEGDATDAIWDDSGDPPDDALDD